MNKIIRVLYTIVYSKVFNRCRCRINKAPVYLLSEFWQNGSALCHNLQNLDDQCLTPVLSKFKEILLLISDIGTCWKLCHFWNTCGFARFSHGLLWSKSWLYFSVFKSCISRYSSLEKKLHTSSKNDNCNNKTSCSQTQDHIQCPRNISNSLPSIIQANGNFQSISHILFMEFIPNTHLWINLNTACCSVSLSFDLAVCAFF